MKQKFGGILILFYLFAIHSSAQNCYMVCNGGADSVFITNTQAFVDSSQFPCWYTTSPDGLMEIWGNGYSGVPSYSGSQFIELNAHYASTLYQNIYVNPGAGLTISFAHRGRGGIDTMSVSVGPVGGPYAILGYYGDGTTAWGYYTVNYNIPTNLGNYYSVRFTAVYSAFAPSPQTVGNFMDAVTVCQSEGKPTGEFELSGDGNLQLFPNPVTDGGITILNPSNEVIKEYQIFDSFGRRILSGTSNGINTNEITPGTYFIRITTAKGNITEKLIIL